MPFGFPSPFVLARNRLTKGKRRKPHKRSAAEQRLRDLVADGALYIASRTSPNTIIGNLSRDWIDVDVEEDPEDVLPRDEVKKR